MSRKPGYQWCGTPAKRRESRNKAYAKIVINWKRSRPDLRHSASELRDELHAFCAEVLGLDRVDSLRDLSDSQLGRVIEAIGVSHKDGTTTGCTVHHIKAKGKTRESPKQEATSSKVHFLSGTPEQIWAMRRILEHLTWSDEYKRKWFKDRFGRDNEARLNPQQSQSAVRMLLNCAAHRDLKLTHPDSRIPRDMIKEYIPALKMRLGIDQQGTVANAV